ncbi:MAG: DNA gyrase subunit A [Chloroflexota bacterium]
MEVGTVQLVDIEQEMQTAYLDYAMSVIVARALPDVRDGLKPVQRRILYAMHDMGLRPTTAYRKSARIVGEVLGKYHPHSDAAVYDAMARMAQDFSLRYPLVDGQGNFGSIDGDAPAAMRYTEARTTTIALEMLNDIEKRTVDFRPNFDETLREPTVLPGGMPNLLVNGASGIAVGMATNIPPHNLAEVCDALVYLIEHYKKLDDVTIEDLMRFIQGPDFPTGGVIYRQSDGDGDGDTLRTAYAVGRGRISVQAKAHVEEMTRNRSRIVITELPYQVNKTNLIERIAELVRDSRIEGIVDLRDESDRRGMRIAIELTRTVEAKDILEQLYKSTPLRTTFGVNMVALVDDVPRLLSLKKMLEHYLEHRRQIVTRRTQYDLEQAKHRAHILEGLLKALDFLDEVIDTIRRSRTADTARANLQRRFQLTEIQAQAILDMPLKRLAALERRKLADEYKELKSRIQYLESLLHSPAKLLGVIKDELLALKEKYGDPRRTTVAGQVGVTLDEIVQEEESLVALSQRGHIRRSSTDQRRSISAGRGKDVITHLLHVSGGDDLYLIGKDGRAAWLPVHQVPDITSQGNGVAVAELRPDLGDAEIVALLVLPRTETPEGHLLIATAGGRVKRCSLADFISAASKGPTEIVGLEQGDWVVSVYLTNDDQEVLIVTSQGKGIRFQLEEVRPMGLPASGVGAIRLAPGDWVVAALPARKSGQLLTVTNLGWAKRSPLSSFPTQKRYGAGVVTHNTSRRNGQVVTACVVGRGGHIDVLTAKGGVVRLAIKDVPGMNRSTLGKPVIDLKADDAPTGIRIETVSASIQAEPIKAEE